MSQRKRLRPSPAMIVATVALFVALGGGAYAGVAFNQVRSAHIKNGEVKTADLANLAVTNAKLRNSAVNSPKIRDGSILLRDISGTAQAALKGNTGATGPQGPAGPQGAAGSARAYAQVNDGGASSLIAARTKGFTGVSRIATGVYCLALDPALGIDPLAVSVLAAPEWGNSTLTAGAIVAARGAADSIPDPCPAGNIAVRTMNGSGTLVDTIAFYALVP